MTAMKRSVIPAELVPLLLSGVLALFYALAGASSVSAAAASDELKTLQAQYTDLYRDGRYDEAREPAQEALALAIRHYGAGHEQTAIQAQSVAMIAEAAGDLATAERYFRQALAIDKKVYGADSAGVSQVLDRLAAVVLNAGRPAEAQPLYERELAIRQELLGDHAYSADAYAGLADVKRVEGDFAAAMPQYRKAIQLLTNQNRAEQQVLAKSVFETEIKRHREIFVGLARAASALRREPGANTAALTDESFAAGQLAWSTAAASALAKMTARLKVGDTEMGRAIQEMQALSDRILALHDQDMKALADWSKIQREDKVYSQLLDQFRAASIEQGKWNAPFIKRQRELIAQLQDELKRCPPGQAKPGCENSRSAQDAISKELGALSAEVGKGAGDITSLNRRMQEAEKRLPGYAEFTAGRTAALKEMQELQSRLVAKRAAIVAAFPQFLSLAEPEPLSVAETQSLLKPDEALVSMLVGATKTIVWVITRDRADWADVSVGERALAEHVAILRLGLDPLAPGVSDSVATTVAGNYDLLRAYVVYKLLLEPFEPLLAGKRHLLLVPTGPLTSLPFQVLLTRPPRPNAPPLEAFRDAPWLIKQYALSVLPSVESLRSLRKFAAEGRAVKPFFGLGDPVLVGPPAGQRKRGASPLYKFYRDGKVDIRAVRELTPLPDTAQELESIAKIFGVPRSALNLREKATETRVKTASLKDYRVIEFATHGLVAGDLSGLAEPALVLTPPDKPTAEDDGLLTASEIAGLTLDADWVVLSACNTAAGERVGADALSGLARAFFFAGARALLVSHWSVYSKAAVELTTRTFRNLAKAPGAGRAEAFRQAMLSLIAEGRPPSYWAPFVVVGEAGAATQ